MNFIEHIFAPARLLLVWQKPQGGGLFTVGELRNHNGTVTFRYLSGTDDFRAAQENGFSCHPAFPLREEEYNEGAIDPFMRRLPPPSRADFAKYLEQWRLPPATVPSDFALLAYSGAKLPSDGFSVVWPLEEVTAPGEILLEVAGFRYQQVALDELEIDMPVTFSPDPDNEHDHKALQMEVNGRRIGYVKRTQCGAVRDWLGRYDVNARIERFNGTSKRPIVYVFCRLSPQTSLGR